MPQPNENDFAELEREFDALAIEADDYREQRDQAREQVQELTETVSSLKLRLKEAEEEAQDALSRVEFLEGEITEPTELMLAARKLLEQLDKAFGVERFDESLQAYDIFRKMDDLHDALRKPSSPLADYAQMHGLRLETSAWAVH